MFESKQKNLRELLAGVGPYHARGPMDRPVTRRPAALRAAAAELLEGMGWTVPGETSRFEANFIRPDHELEVVL